MPARRQAIGQLDAVHPQRACLGLCVATLQPTMGGCMDRARESPLVRADFHIMLLCSGGSGDQAVDLSVHHHEPGSLLWIRPGQVHQSAPDIDGMAICFTDGFLGDDLPQAGASSWRFAPADLGDIRAHIAVLQAEYERFVFGPTSPRLTTGESMLRHLLLALLLRIDQVSPCREIRPTPAHPVAQAFLDMVDRCFPTIHTVEEYGAVLGYSTRTIARASVEATGLTPKQVIDARLVLEARRLLAYTDLSVCAVGRRLGFDDAANFCRFFTRSTGMSPGTFRASRGI